MRPVPQSDDLLIPHPTTDISIEHKLEEEEEGNNV